MASAKISFPHLTLLNLDNNAVQNWAQVGCSERRSTHSQLFDCFVLLPNIEVLILARNQLDSITIPQHSDRLLLLTDLNLKFLGLLSSILIHSYNSLRDWLSVSLLSYLP